MNTFSSTKKILVPLILVSLLVLGAYAFLYFKIYTDNKETAYKLSESSVDFEKNERIRLAKSELAKNDDFISNIDTHFISRDSVVSFINEIETLGKNTNVDTTISSIEPVIETKDKSDLTESLHVKLEVSGSWIHVVDFITTLENLPYKIVIEEAQIKLAGANDVLQFTSASSTTSRPRTDAEVWKATVDFTILKLK